MLQKLIAGIACRLGAHDLVEYGSGRAYCLRSGRCRGRILWKSKGHRLQAEAEARAEEQRTFEAHLAAYHQAGGIVYQTKPRVRIPSTRA